MGFLSMILGILSILTTAAGVVVALKVVPEFAGLSWPFWFGATVILLLGSISSSLSGRSEY